MRTNGVKKVVFGSRSKFIKKSVSIPAALGPHINIRLMGQPVYRHQFSSYVTTLIAADQQSAQEERDAPAKSARTRNR